MKTQITIALLTLSLLTAIVPPAQAFDISNSKNGPGFPTDIDDDNEPSWPGSPHGGTVFSQPAIKKGMTIPGSNSGNTIIDGNGIDVSTPVVPYVDVGQDGIAIAPTDSRLAASCQVAGTPAEFPDDLLVTNTGNRPIPAGALVSWRVAGPDFAGKARLASPLQPGQSAQLRNAIPGGASPETDCFIRGINA